MVRGVSVRASPAHATVLLSALFSSQPSTFSALNGHFCSNWQLLLTSTLERHSAVSFTTVLRALVAQKGTGTHFLWSWQGVLRSFCTVWQLRTSAKRVRAPQSEQVRTQIGSRITHVYAVSHARRPSNRPYLTFNLDAEGAPSTCFLV